LVLRHRIRLDWLLEPGLWLWLKVWLVLLSSHWLLDHIRRWLRIGLLRMRIGICLDLRRRGRPCIRRLWMHSGTLVRVLLGLSIHWRWPLSSRECLYIGKHAHLRSYGCVHRLAIPVVVLVVALP
jgi:hypothetical protein